MERLRVFRLFVLNTMTQGVLSRDVFDFIRDVNTGEREVAWMLEAYEKKVGYHAPAAFTGKPIEISGSLGRSEATGWGGFCTLESYRYTYKFDPKKTMIAVQGFGNVGYWFAKFTADERYKVVAVSDSSGALYVQGVSLDIDKLMDLKNEYGSFKEISLGNKHKFRLEADQPLAEKFITNEELLSLKVDVLVPAALENALIKQNTDKVQIKVVLEMANGPTTPEAEDILLKKDIHVLPDVLCNAGGVTVSYFEWMQNLLRDRWSRQKVDDELKKKS